MTDNRHVPVMAKESLEALAPVATEGPGLLVDCTLGGAGHASAMLGAYSKCRVLACDMDAQAIEAARHKLEQEVASGRLAFFHGNFSSLVGSPAPTLPTGFSPPWNGVLMDLGYSSNQLEDPRYGMSFSVDAPLDMRLARGGEGQAQGSQLTAWELVTQSTAQELGDILKAYAEIPGAHRLARRIQEGIQSGRVTNSTTSLARFLEQSAPRGSKDKIHPATLVFQALRIAVNDELRVLDHFLEGVILNLAPKGRIAVITFHSLEDRVVKRWGLRHPNELTAVTSKPRVASPEEIRINPRSRSAKLRVYERTR